jgi:hypothetical protein
VSVKSKKRRVRRHRIRTFQEQAVILRLDKRAAHLLDTAHRRGFTGEEGGRGNRFEDPLVKKAIAEHVAAVHALTWHKPHGKLTTEILEDLPRHPSLRRLAPRGRATKRR